VEMRGNLRNYREMVDNTATVGRDSKGYTASVGAEYGDKKGMYFVDANIGYKAQDYDASIYDTVSAAALSAEGFWQVNPALRFVGELDRTIEENTNTGVSSYIRTRAKAEAEYNFTPEWSVSAWTRATENDFQANPDLAVGRTDMIYDGSVGTRYQINKALAVGLDYTHTTRNSDSRPDIEYDRNLVMVRMVAAEF